MGAHHPIKVRSKIRLTFEMDEIPRHFIAGMAVPTHISNGVNLLFPAGERFFIRSVRRYLPLVEEKKPELAGKIKDFFGQEGSHAREHERHFQWLRDQGYDVDTFLKAYHYVAFGILEKAVGPKLCLSVTAALEHFTASLAERGITSKQYHQHIHPRMLDLFMWHAAEEIEHKSVAFDVLKLVDPSIGLRRAGMVAAAITLVPFWIMGALWMMSQEDESIRVLFKQFAAGQKNRQSTGSESDAEVLYRAFWEYMQPDFHPDNHDNYHLALRVFEEILSPDAREQAAA